MFNINKEKIKINIIPSILFISSIIIALSNSENIRKVLLYLEIFLLGMQVQIVLNNVMIKNKKVKN